MLIYTAAKYLITCFGQSVKAKVNMCRANNARFNFLHGKEIEKMQHSVDLALTHAILFAKENVRFWIATCDGKLNWIFTYLYILFHASQIPHTWTIDVGVRVLCFCSFYSVRSFPEVIPLPTCHIAGYVSVDKSSIGFEVIDTSFMFSPWMRHIRKPKTTNEW